MAYTYGSRHATNLHAHAGIIVTPGVSNALSPKAPINANVAYGVHASIGNDNQILLITIQIIFIPEIRSYIYQIKMPKYIKLKVILPATNKKQIVIAALAIRISAEDD